MTTSIWPDGQWPCKCVVPLAQPIDYQPGRTATALLQPASVLECQRCSTRRDQVLPAPKTGLRVQRPMWRCGCQKVHRPLVLNCPGCQYVSPFSLGDPEQW